MSQHVPTLFQDALMDPSSAPMYSNFQVYFHHISHANIWHIHLKLVDIQHCIFLLVRILDQWMEWGSLFSDKSRHVPTTCFHFVPGSKPPTERGGGAWSEVEPPFSAQWAHWTKQSPAWMWGGQRNHPDSWAWLWMWGQQKSCRSIGFHGGFMGILLENIGI